MQLDLAALVSNCAPKVSPNTMLAIIKTESLGNPWALALNKGKKLRYQATSLAQAQAWAEYLERHNYDFDVGLAQVNIKNIHRYGYKARDMLNTCTNLQVASDILYTNYVSALKNVKQPTRSAVFMALSAYNSGNFQRGFSNGYVYKVIKNAQLQNAQ